MRLPHRFGRYVLLEKLAQGGLAEIYRAQYSAESGFSKEVAVKRLLPIWSDNKQFTNMLVDEAKALVHLSHPNIVQVFELGRDQELFYISMELVDGVDLRQLFQKMVTEKIVLPRKLLLFIFAEVIRALDFAHSKKDGSGKELKIIHRDISPQNIMVSYDGAVKVADFGIAKGLHRSWETTVTQIKGKFSYMSPEQAVGGDIDARSDLYSLGIVLYEFLSGRRLFEGASDLAVLESVRQGSLPKEGLADLPKELREIIYKLLQKNLEDRYPTATELLADIHRFASERQEWGNGFELSQFLKNIFPEKPKVPLLGEATRKTLLMKANTSSAPKQKQKWWVGVSGVALALVLIFAGWKWIPFFSSGSGTGSVHIETDPPVARVVLKVGDKEVRGETPFSLEGLDVQKEMPVILSIQKGEYRSIEERFALNSSIHSFSRKYVLEKATPATLNIQAQPWGYVTIPGVMSKQETPLTGISLKPGSYTIRVYYPPSETWVQSLLTVADGGRHSCLAIFGDKATLTCRK